MVLTWVTAGSYGSWPVFRVWRHPVLAAVLCAGFAWLPVGAWEPLRAHRGNPRVFEFRGEPAVLLTYGEHYGSVINADFEFPRYLDTLRRDGMNLTRVFLLGFRVERKNAKTGPLGPEASAYLQPWRRVAERGNALDGLGKWDFDTWNEDYFCRLGSFVKACSERGIVVELTLFCTNYTEAQWRLSPFHPANNTQGLGPANRYDSLRPADARLLAVQEAAVRRIVREVNACDNVYFEIQNEPFWNGPGVGDEQEVAFHQRMLEVIRTEEAGMKNRHLVAHNFPRRMAALKGFDVINEHYPAAVPEADIAGAEALLDDPRAAGRILALDETETTSPAQTRLEAWMFILGGGAVYNGLDVPDHVYTVEDETGDGPFGRDSRRMLRQLRNYLIGLDLVSLRRDRSWIKEGMPAGSTVQAMAVPGRQYVAYLHHGRSGRRKFQLSYDPIDGTERKAAWVVTLEKGKWRAVWTRPADLAELRVEEFEHPGGSRALGLAVYREDVALRIDRVGE